MYSQFRAEALQANSQFQHLEERHSGNGPAGEDLFTDYFFTPEKKSKCLLHISGIHGIEGYIGSLIQKEILKRDFRNSAFQIVLVHSVNPYGMAHYLRSNANNVDLNRNSMEVHALENPNFHELLPYFKKGTWVEFLKLLPVFLKLGVNETVATVGRGQTEFPDSLFFAGHELQPELVLLQKNLKNLLDPEARIYCIDIHSGLGKKGQETLLLDGFESPEERRHWTATFQKELISPNDDARSYRAEGPLSLLLKKQWKAFHVFQEFGTQPVLKVVNALIHKNPEQMLEAFFPNDEAWRRQCVEMGLLRFQQLVQNLS